MNRRELFHSVTAWATRDWQSAVPSPLYVAAVMTLAVFLVGLILWRPATVGYRVTAEVELPCKLSQIPDVRAKTAASVELCLTEATRQQIADAIRAANAAMKRPGRIEVSEVSEEWIRQVHCGLAVTALEATPKSTRLQIAYTGSAASTGPGPQWSAVFLDHFVRSRLSVSAGGSSERLLLARQVRGMRWQLERTRHYERKARFDLEDCINALVEGVDDGTVLSSTGALAEGSSGRMELSAGSDLPVVNPDWERLQEEFTQLTVELDELLRTVTANHPRVRHVTFQMDEVRRQLETTPQWVGSQLAGTPSTTSVSLASAIYPGSGSSGESQGVIPSEAASYQLAKRSYDEAIRQREEAEMELAAAMTRRLAVASDPSLRLGRVIASAALDDRAGGLPSPGRVLGVALVAVLCGAATSWLGRQGRLRRIGSVAQLQQILALPIVGQISMDPTPGQLRRLRWSRVAVRWVTRVAEAGLGLLVLLFLAGLLLQSSAARELLDNPLAAFLDVIRRVVTLRGSW